MPTERSEQAGADTRTLLHVFSTFAVGGPQIRTTTLANALGSAYRHIVLAMDGRYEAMARFAPDIDARALDLPMRKSRAVSLGNLRSLRRAFRETRPDLLLTYNFGALEAVLAAGLGRRFGLLHHEDGFGPDESQGQKARRLWLRRFALRLADRVYLPSKTLEHIARSSWYLPASRLVFIPNAIAMPERRPVPLAPPAFPDGPGSVRIISLAALRAEKDLGRLIAAFAGMPAALEARLIIYGEGQERSALEAEIARLNVGDRVALPGATSDPWAALAGADIYALSSRTEQMPISILEAMASGLPVAGVDVGDVRHMLAADNQPFIMSRNDPDALRDALIRLAQDAGLRERVGAANACHVDAHYRQERMVARVDALYRELAGAGSSA